MIGGEKLLTTYFLNCIAQEIFGHPETSKIPYDYYIALSSTEPKLDGSGVTEPSIDTGYQRVRIDNSHLFFGEINNDRVLNHDKAYFPESIKPWYDISYYAIFKINFFFIS